MAVRIISATSSGIQGILVSVEIDISSGLPTFNIVGMADTSIKESKERVRSAIINSGFDFPINRITVNLAPADIKKDGAQFDLPIAIGILVATNQITSTDEIDNYLFMGELSLFGELKKIRGALPTILEGVNNHITSFIVPNSNAEECSIVENANIYNFENLKQIANFLENKDMLPYTTKNFISNGSIFECDFEEVLGQESSKRAIEIAAAGGHNLILFGPPGSGKSMLAYRIPTVLPSLNYNEALEVTKIYSVSGQLSNEGMIIKRPFRSPHHTSSSVSLVGGGRNLFPGEISLAHNGVLFLDEMLEFKRSVLEVLRQPLEDRVIKIARANGNICYPANFMLVGSLNPCPCGYYASNIKECTCSEYDRKKYLGRLSGPLLDRIDIFTFVNSLSYSDIKEERKGESSVHIKERVEVARELQRLRFAEEGIYCNSQMSQKLINKHCKLDNSCKSLIEKIYDKFHLSSRAYSRILKLARTISDLGGRESICEADIIEAIQYRKFLNENIV